MNFTPIGDRILIKREEEAKTTATGIYIPDSAKEKPFQGKVVAISKEVSENGEIAVDNTVFFSKYGGTELTLEGQEYIVAKVEDILGVVK
jgi:chaperonin GroES